MLLDSQTLLSILILAGSASLQAAVGFAAGLLGIPLLLWAGNTLPEAQIMIIVAMLPQNLLGLWKLRSHIQPGEVAVPSLVRLAFLPIGIFGLAYLVSHHQHLVKPLVGSIVLVAVIAQSINAERWRTAQRWYWILTVFGISGILQGLSGMSAPPMLLWVHGQHFTANRARGFLFAIYLSSFLPQLLLMVFTFSSHLLQSVMISLLAMPLILLGANLGLAIGNRLGDRWLRPVTYFLLVCMAIACLFDPWLSSH